MRLLLDTHVLLWAAGEPEKLSKTARSLLVDESNVLFFSSASIWEIVIKRGLGRDDFKVDPLRLRKMLVTNGYTEISVTSDHALAVDGLPLLHKDPFDRILLAQARSEGFSLVTSDEQLMKYGEGIISASADTQSGCGT
ncbi:MAG: type II toxin-antitoxin system VapC family toxin [Desulfuromonadales bacterium]|nr:type II toxin-antitoxin system VapC family toxin [Desulfuromonadales bacterium]